MTRHGKPVAAVISIEHLDRLRGLAADLRSATLVLSRAITGDGTRSELDATMSSFGFDRVMRTRDPQVVQRPTPAEKVVSDDRPTPVQGTLRVVRDHFSNLSLRTSAWALPQVLRG